jgi:hypothetical protein
MAIHLYEAVYGNSITNNYLAVQARSYVHAVLNEATIPNANISGVQHYRAFAHDRVNSDAAMQIAESERGPGDSGQAD